ncbi:hypothetical protein [Cytobacillus oceanisediminis]|nr:hypothetical protein [Cytobacillus oceanisediminis]
MIDYWLLFEAAMKLCHHAPGLLHPLSVKKPLAHSPGRPNSLID